MLIFFSGEKILIHGAAGGVGSFAVQFAKWADPDEVIGTASSHDTEFLFDIGADNIIDYMTRRFEGIVQNVDIVFDTVGGYFRTVLESVEKRNRQIGIYPCYRDAI